MSRSLLYNRLLLVLGEITWNSLNLRLFICNTEMLFSTPLASQRWMFREVL